MILKGSKNIGWVPAAFLFVKVSSERLTTQVSSVSHHLLRSILAENNSSTGFVPDRMYNNYLTIDLLLREGSRTGVLPNASC